VAHDFNNALAAILGRTQLLRRTTSDPEVAHSLDIIQTAAEDAAATVRRISTFARQSRSAEFERLDVVELLRDAIEITRTRWEHEALSRGLRYRVHLDAEPGLDIEGSASELREVFVNLIVNAVDAMPEGGDLRIRAARDTHHVQLFFIDTGTGMTDEVRARIFEPFFSTKGLQGTGLGLFVSYGIVERHKGHLGVESEAGSGTTFTLNLPRADAPTADAAHDGEAAGARPLSVLVVDDEPFVRDTLVEMLLALGHNVAAADGGQAALDALAADAYDLVFTDLSMPEMDGWEVAREIRRRYGQKIGLVIVTGYGKETTEPDGDQHLVDGVIGKPFDFTQVEETIARATERQPVKEG
jgi:CheY-like chemotaxis protein